MPFYRSQTHGHRIAEWLGIVPVPQGLPGKGEQHAKG